MDIASEVLRYGVCKMTMPRSLILQIRRVSGNGIRKMIVSQKSFLKPAFLNVYGMRELFSELVTEQQSPHLPDRQYLYGQYQQQE